MLISVKNVFNNEGECLPVKTDVDFSHIAGGEESFFQTPVRAEGMIRNRAGIVEFDYAVTFTYLAQCDRCAEPTRRDYSMQFSHILVTQLNNEDIGDFLVVENMQLDVDELIYDDVLLNMPEKYLCKEDCQGLCSQCGANLNKGKCTCKKPVDPRLEGLLSLLDNE